MSRQIPMGSIVTAVLDGFVEAQENYESWSGGFWLWQAPEYLISSTVAKRIANLDGPKYITLEHGARSALKEAGAKSKGRLPRDIREKGRVDILLWWGNDTPRAVIEIKNQNPEKAQYEKDIKRIAGFVGRNKDESSLQFGIFAFYESAVDGDRKTAVEKIQDRIKTRYEKSIVVVGSSCIITKNVTNIHKVEDSAWAAVCLLIRPNTSEQSNQS